MSRFNEGRAATVLVEAAYIGDVRAIHRFKVTQRSITGWRHRLEKDKHFAAVFLEKKAIAESRWADRLIPAIVRTIEFIGDAAETGDSHDPEMVKAISEAGRGLLEAQFTRDMLNARIAGQGGAEPQEDRSMVAADHPRTGAKSMGATSGASDSGA